MHFCFLFRFLELGGTETLMARMSHWLVCQGHQVTILSPVNGPMDQCFAKGVYVIVDKRYNDTLYGGPLAARDLLKSTLKKRHVDVFYAFSTDALWVAAALVNVQARPSKCLAGVYVQGGYVIGPRAVKRPWLASLAYPAQVLFQRELPSKCRLYMNAAVKDYLEARSIIPLPGVIWPLPVDGSRFGQVRRSPVTGTIVSVGRLDRMKEYNLWMIDVVSRLHRNGLKVRWEVYGDGELRNQMLDKIRRLGLEKHIELKGSIPYSQLNRAFETATVFVGMGTTLIEAALAGVPAIVAGAFDTTGKSYGFLYDLPEYCCGEVIARPVRPIEEYLIQVLKAAPAEYKMISESCRHHAQRFDLNAAMKRFIQIVSDAPLVDHLWRPGWRYYAAAFYETAINWYGRATGHYNHASLDKSLVVNNNRRA